MKHLYSAGGALLLSFSIASATITNWTFRNNAVYDPADSLGYSFTSDKDTVKTRIFIETGEASSGLDTVVDQKLFSIMMVDNNTDEKWGEDKGLMPDRDPADNAFLFSPGKSGLAPGLYHVVLSDGESALSDTFRITPIQNVYRTVSGTVVAPESTSSSFIMVHLDMKVEDGFSLSAFTDANGKYTFAVSEQMVTDAAGKFMVKADKNIEGYTVLPSMYEIDLIAGSKDGVNFKYEKATCSVKGTVRTPNGVLPGVRVVLLDFQYSQITGTQADEQGNYIINCQPGSYLIRAEIMEKENYLNPKEMKVQVETGMTAQMDIKVLPCDGFIYGRVTVKGSAPNGATYAVHAYNEQYGGRRVLTDENGRFSIPVATIGGKYGVSLANDKEYILPENLVVENGRIWVEAAVGDTVNYNLIEKPTGGLSGTIENATTAVAAKYFVNLYSADSLKRVFKFETKESGAYSFTGVVPGVYYAEAGMSVVGGEEWQWKSHARYADATGANAKLIIENAVLPNISWKFTKLDSVTTPTVTEPKGSGFLKVTVNDSVDAQFEKCVVMLLDKIPAQGENVQPVKTYGFGPIPNEIICKEVPNKKLFVAVEVVGKSGDKYVRYRSMIKDEQGNPLALAFDEKDSIAGSVMVTSADLMMNEGTPVVIPEGNGKVNGKVTYTGTLPKEKIMVLLYEESSNDWVKIARPDSMGGYLFDKIPAGRYRTGAAIDTNGDKQAEALVVSAKLLVFTKDENYEQVDLALVDKQKGTGVIKGFVDASFTLPQNASIVLSAFAVDTTQPDSTQVNKVALMSGYIARLAAPGSYTIEGIPDGVYYVAAITEVKDPSTGKVYEAAFGIFGKPAPESSARMKVDPVPVVIVNGQSVDSVKIALVAVERKDNVAVSARANSLLPSSYGLLNVLPNVQHGICVRFAVPEKAVVGFTVLDLQGRQLAKVQSQTFAHGYHSVVVGTKYGKTSGVYIVKMQSKAFKSSKLVRVAR